MEPSFLLDLNWPDETQYVNQINENILTETWAVFGKHCQVFVTHFSFSGFGKFLVFYCYCWSSFVCRLKTKVIKMMHLRTWLRCENPHNSYIDWDVSETLGSKYVSSVDHKMPFTQTECNHFIMALIFFYRLWLLWEWDRPTDRISKALGTRETVHALHRQPTHNWNHQWHY